MNEQETEIEAHSDAPTENNQGGILSGPPDGFGKNVNDYLNHYVTVADAKAGAILAINFVVIQFLVGDHFAAPFELPLHYVSLGFLSLSSISTLLILFPRLPKGARGFVFWEDIRDNPNDEIYIDSLASLDRIAKEKEYARQNYYASHVLHRKMRWVQWAIGLFIVGAVGSLLCAIL